LRGHPKTLTTKSIKKFIDGQGIMTSGMVKTLKIYDLRDNPQPIPKHFSLKRLGFLLKYMGAVHRLNVGRDDY
jgi:hypothetical protein